MEIAFLDLNSTRRDLQNANIGYSTSSVSIQEASWNGRVFNRISANSFENNISDDSDGNQREYKIPTPTSTISGFFIGHDSDASLTYNDAHNYDYFDGELGEILIYNTSISPNKRRLIKNYLKNKWQ